MEGLSSLIKQVGLARLAAIIGVTGGVAAALAAIMLRLGEPPMALLFAGLELEDAQDITLYLEQANVPYEIRGGGTAILVPKDNVMNLRLTLSSEGLPAGGTVGYEIFDQGDALGSSAFQQNVNKLRALEGELARTIRSINSIRSARVHLVIPERELFSREKKTPSASIVVDVGRNTLPPSSVRAIQNLVASAVPDLSPDSVTILDSGGALLARSRKEDGESEFAEAGLLEERTASTEARIRRTVENIVAGIIGEDNVRVQVSVEMDFSRVTESSEIFDPDGQVVLSTTTIEDTTNSRNRSEEQAVTVANNLPDADVGGGGPESTSNSSRTEETVNFEISKTVRNEVQEVGEIERLSVAVAVNGVWALNDTGEFDYTPRTDEEMQRISALVRSAIGYTDGRDQLEVINVQFEKPRLPEVVEEAAPFLGLGKDDILRIVEIAVLGILGLILIFFVLGPFLSGKKDKKAADAQLALTSAATAQLPAPDGAAVAGPDGAAQLAGPDGAAPALPAPGGGDVNEFQQQIDIAQIQGNVKASSVKKVSEIVEKHPEESISILRNWLHAG